MQKAYKRLNGCLKNNLEILTSRILDDDELPIIRNKSKMFRFESFGDIVSDAQVVNYFKISDANPEIDCALWSKNPQFIQKAIRKYGLHKPNNLVIVGSSYFINEPMIDFYKAYDFVDYIFTVYDPKYIKENNIDINCGGRSCISCRKCYKKSHNGYEIREKLK